MLNKGSTIGRNVLLSLTFKASTIRLHHYLPPLLNCQSKQTVPKVSIKAVSLNAYKLWLIVCSLARISPHIIPFPYTPILVFFAALTSVIPQIGN